MQAQEQNTSCRVFPTDDFVARTLWQGQNLDEGARISDETSGGGEDAMGRR